MPATCGLLLLRPSGKRTFLIWDVFSSPTSHLRTLTVTLGPVRNDCKLKSHHSSLSQTAQSRGLREDGAAPCQVRADFELRGTQGRWFWRPDCFCLSVELCLTQSFPQWNVAVNSPLANGFPPLQLVQRLLAIPIKLIICFCKG